MPQPSHYANPNSWTVFNRWTVPSKPARWVKGNWKVFDALVPHFHKITEEKCKELHMLLAEWDKHFDAYGKDPTHENWNAFRLLRLSREEDWSDWLA